MAEYEAAWDEAVRVFGRNRVSTYLLVGLGEDPDELVAGAGRLIERGVYPFVVPFRPMAGTLARRDGIRGPAAELLRDVTAGSPTAAGGRHARRRPAGRLRGLRRVQRTVRGGGVNMPPAVYRRAEALASVLLGRHHPAARLPDRARCGSVTLAAYQRLRNRVFVDEQGLFTGHDHDDRDDDPRTLVLVARDPAGDRARRRAARPGRRRARPGLVVRRPARGRVRAARVRESAALVRAACAHAESAGVLRFEATVQARNEVLFRRLGWTSVRPVTVAAAPHVLMRWPIGRIAVQVAATKSDLGGLLSGLVPAGLVIVGDDGAPVPGSDLVAACDAILPSMVERDPEWAGWCSVLVNLNDLAAMGADTGGPARRARCPGRARSPAGCCPGCGRAAQAYGVPVLGGHTQLGVPAALSVTALGRAAHPIRGGGGRPGHRIRLTVDQRAVGGPGMPVASGTPLAPPDRRTARDARLGGHGPAGRRQGRLDGGAGRHPRHARRGERLPGGAGRRRGAQTARRHRRATGSPASPGSGCSPPTGRTVRRRRPVRRPARDCGELVAGARRGTALAGR